MYTSDTILPNVGEIIWREEWEETSFTTETYHLTPEQVELSNEEILECIGLEPSGCVQPGARFCASVKVIHRDDNYGFIMVLIRWGINI